MNTWPTFCSSDMPASTCSATAWADGGPGPGVLLGSAVVRPTGPGVPPAAVLGPALGVGLLVGVVNSLFTLIWALAVTVQTSALLAGEPMSFGQVYRHALARFLPT